MLFVSQGERPQFDNDQHPSLMNIQKYASASRCALDMVHISQHDLHTSKTLTAPWSSVNNVWASRDTHDCVLDSGVQMGLPLEYPSSRYRSQRRPLLRTDEPTENRLIEVKALLKQTYWVYQLQIDWMIVMYLKSLCSICVREVFLQEAKIGSTLQCLDTFTNLMVS